MPDPNDYTTLARCSACPCPIENAQRSAPDAPWRTCDCRCHDTARQIVLHIGPA